jgi:chromosome partitioning protein
MGLGIDTENLTCSTYDIFMDPAARIRDATHPVSHRLDVVPSSVVLSAVEQQLSGQPDRENRLRGKLEACENDYDYIIIDCPPSIGLLTFNALIACKEALVVMEPSYYSLHGAAKLIDTIRLVRDQLGLRKRVRLLVTLFDRRTRFNKKFMIDACNRFGPGMIETIIRRSTRFKEAANRGVPICRHARSCGGAQDYIRLAEEIILHEEQLNIDDFDAVAGIKERGPAPGTPEWVFSHPGPQLVGKSIHFSLLAPTASMVELVGSFNQWDQEDSILLNRKSNGLWVANVDLEPGRHLYKFIVDGKWIPDPANENRLSPNEDCILEVPEEQPETESIETTEDESIAMSEEEA